MNKDNENYAGLTENDVKLLDTILKENHQRHVVASYLERIADCRRYEIKEMDRFFRYLELLKKDGCIETQGDVNKIKTRAKGVVKRVSN